jgi:hypothetical protein
MLVKYHEVFYASTDKIFGLAFVYEGVWEKQNGGPMQYKPLAVCLQFYS